MKEIVAQALAHAHQLLEEHEEWDLIRALAEATTGQRHQVPVFAAAKTAVEEMIAVETQLSLREFNDTAPREKALWMLEAARLVASS